MGQMKVTLEKITLIIVIMNDTSLIPMGNSLQDATVPGANMEKNERQGRSGGVGKRDEKRKGEG